MRFLAVTHSYGLTSVTWCVIRTTRETQCKLRNVDRKWEMRICRAKLANSGSPHQGAPWERTLFICEWNLSVPFFQTAILFLRLYANHSNFPFCLAMTTTCMTDFCVGNKNRTTITIVINCYRSFFPLSNLCLHSCVLPEEIICLCMFQFSSTRGTRERATRRRGEKDGVS